MVVVGGSIIGVIVVGVAVVTAPALGQPKASNMCLACMQPIR